MNAVDPRTKPTTDAVGFRTIEPRNEHDQDTIAFTSIK